MKKTLTLCLFIMALAGCVTPQPVSPVQTTRTFPANYDRVWGTIVSELSADYPIQNVDKASGLITTQPLTLASGLWDSEDKLKQYAYSPGIILGTYNNAQCSLTVFVSKSDETNTSVRVTARFQGFENNVTQSWQTWQSNGVMENQFLDKIGQLLVSK